MISSKIINIKDLEKIAAKIRFDVIDMAVVKASHHIGCALDIVEILTSLYFQHLNVNPKDVKDPNRDIFILSKGHAAASLYVTLFRKGFFDRKLLETYDQDGTTLQNMRTSKSLGLNYPLDLWVMVCLLGMVLR